MGRSFQLQRVLVFDLGGVLVVNDVFEELQKLVVGDIFVDALRTSWLRSAAVRAFELGICSPEKFAESIVEEFELAVTPSRFLSAFANWPKGLHPGADFLLADLRKRFLIGCLSNSNEIHWTTQVTSHFDFSYSSHLMKRIKPDVGVFEFVTAALGCAPHEIIFFDDSRLNIDSATRYGWEAYLTDGYSELQRVLGDLHLLG